MRPASRVPTNEPMTMASTCIASRGMARCRMFPAMVKSSMLV